MVLAAFIFGILIFSSSLVFLLSYVRSDKSIRRNYGALARQRERQLKFEADLQARIELDARKYEEARQALLKRKRDNSESARRNIEHAA